MKVHSVNCWAFLKFGVSRTFGHCDHSPRAPQILSAWLYGKCCLSVFFYKHVAQTCVEKPNHRSGCNDYGGGLEYQGFDCRQRRRISVSAGTGE